VKKILLALALIATISFSGCIDVSNFLRKEGRYEWITVVDAEDDFKWVDIINPEIAKNVSMPIIVKEKTKYLHITVSVNFSNPLSSDVQLFSQGSLNLFILTPSEEINKNYTTTAKSRSYEEYFYFADPLPGEWDIILKLIGYGKYRIFVEAYQQV